MPNVITSFRNDIRIILITRIYNYRFTNIRHHRFLFLIWLVLLHESNLSTKIPGNIKIS